jgi:hypothetical protein
MEVHAMILLILWQVILVAAVIADGKEVTASSRKGYCLMMHCSVDVVVATSLVAQAEESKLYILYIVSACMVAIATAVFSYLEPKR